MRDDLKHIRQSVLWLLLLLAVDAFAALLLWLADAEAFYSMSAVCLISTCLLFWCVCRILGRRGQKKEKAFLDFLDNPDKYHEELLLKAVSGAEREKIRLLGETLRGKREAYTVLKEQLRDYEEYVEAWAHETKTPLSLLTLLLDNRRDELPKEVYFKLDYSRNRIQESIEQMLFYARLKGTRKDYLFEYVCIRESVEAVTEDYRPLLEEKNFRIEYGISEDKVYTDRRGLRFILGQLVSNSVKYCGSEPELRFVFFKEKERCVLAVKDNGMGVRSCDFPYIFEKGFTGDTGEGRKSSTGMGLYLAKEIAKEMHVTLEADSQWEKGFEMRIFFPDV